MTKRKPPEPFVIPDTPEAKEAIDKLFAEAAERQKSFMSSVRAHALRNGTPAPGSIEEELVRVIDFGLGTLKK